MTNTTDTKSTTSKATKATTANSKVPAEYLQPNGKYRPGYDAKHAGDVARKIVETGKTTHLNELPTDALKAKASRLAEAWTIKAEAKLEREAAREAKALAAAEAKATADSK